MNPRLVHRQKDFNSVGQRAMTFLSSSQWRKQAQNRRAYSKACLFNGPSSYQQLRNLLRPSAFSGLPQRGSRLNALPTECRQVWICGELQQSLNGIDICTSGCPDKRGPPVAILRVDDSAKGFELAQEISMAFLGGDVHGRFQVADALRINVDAGRDENIDPGHLCFAGGKVQQGLAEGVGDLWVGTSNKQELRDGGMSGDARLDLALRRRWAGAFGAREAGGRGGARVGGREVLEGVEQGGEVQIGRAHV